MRPFLIGYSADIDYLNYLPGLENIPDNLF